MNPIGLPLLLLGYMLVLTVGAQMKKVVDTQNRVALTGHQVGIGLVCLGWVTIGRVPLIWPHLLWAIGAVVWFNWIGTRRTR